MIEINAQRLKALRVQKALSQAELASQARVSPRQIARIEACAGPASLRSVTYERLKKALDVADEVLSGEQPLPDGAEGSDTEALQIHPDRLRELRKSQRLSRKELATKSGVSVRQIARIEGQEGPVAVRSKTMQALTRALRTQPTKLADGEPTPRSQAALSHTELRVPMSHEARLNYDLVSRRYGIRASQIAALAPLMFTLVAEGSLKRRREAVAEVDRVLASLGELRKEHSQLYFTALVTDINEGLGNEERSIAKADLLGDLVRNPESDFGYVSEFAEDVTPFADFLQKLAEELAQPDVVSFNDDRYGYIDLVHGLETVETGQFSLCEQDIRYFAGDSKYARWALLSGDVRLSQVPEELMSEETREQRIKWLESQLSDEVKSIQKSRDAIETHS